MSKISYDQSMCLYLHLAAQPPVITSQPEHQALDHYGGEVALSITTQFGDKFEWFKDGETITSNVYPHCDNCDSPNLVISPFMPEYEGKYKCRVSNEAGYVDSNDAELSKSTLLSIGYTIMEADAI